MWPCEQNGCMGAPTDCTSRHQCDAATARRSHQVTAWNKSVEFCTTCMTESMHSSKREPNSHALVGNDEVDLQCIPRAEPQEKHAYCALGRTGITADSNACHLPPHAGGYRHACTTTFLHTNCSVHDISTACALHAITHNSRTRVLDLVDHTCKP